MKSKISVFMMAVCFALNASGLADQAAAHPLYDDEVEEVQESAEKLVGDNNNLYFSSYKNEFGQTVFKTLPVITTYLTSNQCNGSGLYTVQNVGQFVDVNGDGLLDFVVAYVEEHSGNNNHYRATFINDGGKGWIMDYCESSQDWSKRFPPCQ